MSFINFSFDLFGFDWLSLEDNYGFWLGMIKWNDNENPRSLLSLYNMDGAWMFQFMYMNLVGDFD